MTQETLTQANGAARALPADHVQNAFYQQHILSVRQFDRRSLQYIYRVADEMRSLVKRFGKANLLDGKILANLFYEPSTRTSSSFQAAMLRLASHGAATVTRIGVPAGVAATSVGEISTVPDDTERCERIAVQRVVTSAELASGRMATRAPS